MPEDEKLGAELPTARLDRGAELCLGRVQVAFGK
jgi:hypothetical protein